MSKPSRRGTTINVGRGNRGRGNRGGRNTPPVITTPIIETQENFNVLPSTETVVSLNSPFDADPFSMTEQELTNVMGEVETEEQVFQDPYQSSYQAGGLYNNSLMGSRPSITPEQIQGMLQYLPEEIDLGLSDNFRLGQDLDLDKLPQYLQDNQIQNMLSRGISQEDIDSVISEGGSVEDITANLGKFQQQYSIDSFNEWTSQYRDILENNPEQFAGLYENLPDNAKIQFLYSQQQEGAITDEEYEKYSANIINTRANRNFTEGYDDNPFYAVQVEGKWYFKQKDENNPRRWRDVNFYPEDDSNYSVSEFLKWGIEHSAADLTDDFDPSTAEFFLNSPVTNLMASVIPYGQLALTGARAATGLEVTPTQIASSFLQGLELTGAVNPATNTGLFNTTYDQTQSFVNAVSAGSGEGAALSLFGSDLINTGLDQLGIKASNLGLTEEQLQEGIQSTVQELASGEELDEALASGFGESVLLNVADNLPNVDIDLPSLDFDTPEGIKAIEDAIKAGGSALEDAVKEVMPDISFDTPESIEQFEDVIKEFGSAAEDVVREVGSTAEDIVEPLKEPIEAIGSATEDVVREVGSTLEDIIEPIKDPLLDALGGINLSGLAGINMDGTYRPPVSNIPTQVEELFSDELFKFETEIGISPEYFEYEEFYDNDLMPTRQQPRIYSF